MGNKVSGFVGRKEDLPEQNNKIPFGTQEQRVDGGFVGHLYFLIGLGHSFGAFFSYLVSIVCLGGKPGRDPSLPGFQSDSDGSKPTLFDKFFQESRPFRFSEKGRIRGTLEQRLQISKPGRDCKGN